MRREEAVEAAAKRLADISGQPGNWANYRTPASLAIEAAAPHLFAAVLALHRSKALPYTLPKDQTCTGCGHPWPCPTTQALEA